MKFKNAWGDLPDIYMLAEMYKRRFMVYSVAGTPIATTGDNWEGEGEPIRLLFYHSRKHYDALIPKGWKMIKTANLGLCPFENKRIK